MHWWYVFLEKTKDRIKYAYSTDSKKLDGIISCDTDGKNAAVDVPCDEDAGSNWAVNRARQHFCSVVKEGFPTERHVCCG